MEQDSTLKRQVGLGGAVVVGLGSIIGTGVFVSVGIAAGVAGPAVILAIGIAAVVAICNGLSSAQLAAVHPVSGGTYEYGYRLIGPRVGFTAGWLFLLAKSASAATAALGFAGYLLRIVDGDPALITPIALAAVVLITALVIAGIRRANWLNTLIVSVTVGSLAYFVLGGLGMGEGSSDNLVPFFDRPDGGPPLPGLLEACALMFVAFTGYGRIATLGEEVTRPEVDIPRAVIITTAVVTVLYVGTAVVATMVIGAGALGEATRTEAAPLEVAARAMDVPGLAAVIAVAAMAAMVGVLMNLLLGLSRVMLAMGRRGDMPRATARLNRDRTAPTVAIVAVGAIVLALTLIGDVYVTWSFSAFTVLLYYAITNLAALRLEASQRMYSRLFPVGGLAACVFLAFWVEPWIWLAGIGLVAVGLGWAHLASYLAERRR